MALIDSIRARFNNRNLSNPRQPITGAVLDALGVRKSATGLSVTPENALETTTVWSAVRLISSTIASLPFHVYSRTEAGKDRAPHNALYHVLHTRPNPEMSSFVFRETLMGHALLYGNAYAEIERNGRGEAIAFWPLHPTSVRLDRIGGQKVYMVRVDGQEVPLAAENVLHVPGYSLDGHMGLAPMRMAANAVALSRATEEFGSTFFGNGASPSGVLSHPGKLGKEGADNLRDSWKKLYGGLSNAQRVAILEEGMTWQPLGIPPEHAQFILTRRFQISEIARVFLIPPHMLADLERATFSNIEHQAIQYVQMCIAPWVAKLEQEINFKVWGSNPSFFAEFSMEGLLRGDSAARAAYHTALFNIGVLSPNDIREKENLNRIEGGDQRFTPLNMAPLNAPREAVADAV